MPEATAVVFLGGQIDPMMTSAIRRRLDSLVPGTPVASVAADGGMDRALSLGRPVDHLVGDLDSIDARGLRVAERSGTVIHRHPRDKDATDAELAIDLAVDLMGRNPGDVEPRGEGAAPGGTTGRLVVVGSGAGRVDHLMSVLLLLTSDATAGYDVMALLDETTLHVARPGRPVGFDGRVGEQVSLLPLHGTATGIDTEGLRWPLRRATLRPGTTRGVSNEMAAASVTVSVATGVLAVIATGQMAASVEGRAGRYDPSPSS